MYAVVETGGKQYRVTEGQQFLVDRLPNKQGETVELPQVLLVTDGEQTLVGTPRLNGAKVVATSLGEERGDKVIVFKYKPKVRYRRKKGHHQLYTRLQVNRIVVAGEVTGNGT